MLQFFKYVIATIIGLVTFCFLSFLVLMGIAAIFSSEKVSLADNSVLKINLTKPIQEVTEDNPLEDLNLPFGREIKHLSMQHLRQALELAKEDKKIKGIYLEASDVGADAYATAEEIRNLLTDFKKSGKFIYAYGENFSEKGYFVASVADKIYLHPWGNIEFNGLASQKIYLKHTFEKLGIQPMIFRVGNFKSAVEMFSNDQMSQEDRLQTESYLNSIYNNYLAKISESLNIPAKELENISDKMLVQTPGDAVKYRLASDTVYYDQVEEHLRTKLKITDAKTKITFVSLEHYLKTSEVTESKFGKDKIAVIVGEGTIHSGKSAESSIGSETIAEAIKEARLNNKVKAIVLRINSGGGSALASDVMWREVQLAKKVKPVIASMADFAASGGYYMAMGCDKIVAEPTTITGSIGIFGLMLNTKNFFNDKLGVTFDNAKTGDFSDFGVITKDMTESEKTMIQNFINKGYEVFTHKAAQGRKMHQDTLKKYASGRVWTGAQAKQIGLVDELGGLKMAVDLAQKAAKCDNCVTEYYPAKKDWLDKIFGDTEEGIKTHYLRQDLGQLYPIYQEFQSMIKMDKIQAKLPYKLIIQ